MRRMHPREFTEEELLSASDIIWNVMEMVNDSIGRRFPTQAEAEVLMLRCFNELRERGETGPFDDFDRLRAAVSARLDQLEQEKEERDRMDEALLRTIIREELLREGDVVPVDFRSKAVRARFTPGISDPFIFSGSAGQIARVLEMKRDECTSESCDGGRVVYEQYVEDKDEPGTWIQDPAQPLEKSLVDFMSKYGPFKGTIEHLRQVEEEMAEEEAHMERVMSDEGFPDYKNRSKYSREVIKSKEYMDAFRKAMKTRPPPGRSQSPRDRN